MIKVNETSRVISLARDASLLPLPRGLALASIQICFFFASRRKRSHANGIRPLRGVVVISSLYERFNPAVRFGVFMCRPSLQDRYLDSMPLHIKSYRPCASDTCGPPTFASFIISNLRKWTCVTRPCAYDYILYYTNYSLY